MRTRALGDSGIEVSEIGLGSWLTFAGGVQRDQTEAVTRKAIDLGITYFDTANVYGYGVAEEAWGRILLDYPRDSYVLATKLWAPMDDGSQGLSAEQVHKQLDASLRRLKTDYVDVYFCHRFDLETPVAETLEALTGEVRRRVPLCNFGRSDRDRGGWRSSAPSGRRGLLAGGHGERPSGREPFGRPLRLPHLRHPDGTRRRPLPRRGKDPALC